MHRKKNMEVFYREKKTQRLNKLLKIKLEEPVGETPTPLFVAWMTWKFSYFHLSCG